MNQLEVNDMSNALSQAAVVTLRLAEQGISVVAAMANGRRPVLMVDRLPNDIPSVVKRSHRNGWGGMTVVRAAHYDGCQLEWMQDIVGAYAPEAVAHG